jgi:hypothetical protein
MKNVQRIIAIAITGFVLISGKGPVTINTNAIDLLYRFCTSDPAFELVFTGSVFGESITYMFSIPLHDSIPTSSTIFSTS